MIPNLASDTLTSLCLCRELVALTLQACWPRFPVYSLSLVLLASALLWNLQPWSLCHCSAASSSPSPVTLGEQSTLVCTLAPTPNRSPFFSWQLPGAWHAGLYPREAAIMGANQTNMDVRPWDSGACPPPVPSNQYLTGLERVSLTLPLMHLMRWLCNVLPGLLSKSAPRLSWTLPCFQAPSPSCALEPHPGRCPPDTQASVLLPAALNSSASPDKSGTIPLTFP